MTTLAPLWTDRSDDHRPGPAPCPTPETPALHVDLEAVRQRYRNLTRALPGVRMHYAVKANSARPVLATLARTGSAWDVASPAEIDAVLAVGGDPAAMSYGNTVKRASDIAYAHGVGVRRFTFDAAQELDKLLGHAPCATLLVRIATSSSGADWSLGTKFGCREQDAVALLLRAARHGHRVGVAFHVGSQQRNPDAWDAPLASVGRIRQALRTDGVELTVVDLGGGFPATLLEPTAPIGAYGAAVAGSLRRWLGPDLPELMAEPGRSVVADAGVLESEVVLVAERDGMRWVYLDVGVFGGLAEAIGEAIRYPIDVFRGRRPLTGPQEEVVLAGPSCDGMDVLYQHDRYHLPHGIRPGDRVRFRGAGAYTTSYASTGFNGFSPPTETYG